MTLGITIVTAYLREISVEVKAVVLGVSGGIGGSRLIRGAVIDIKENAYFQAVEVIGASRWRTFIRHVLCPSGLGNDEHS